MKRHKQIYHKRSDSCVNCYELVMVVREPKKRSRIRKCMYWAWQYQSDKQFIKKYFNNTLTMKPLDLFLTKEAFEKYAIRLREEKAREYGMTLEQWDEAVRTGAIINPITPTPPPPNDNIQ